MLTDLTARVMTRGCLVLDADADNTSVTDVRLTMSAKRSP
jgi:hypothetical protein